MAHPVKGKLADKVLIQLIEADVDIGFGLVDEAKAFRVAGEPEMRSRVLHDLGDIIADIECRLQRLGDSGSVPFRALVDELRDEIAAAKQEAS